MNKNFITIENKQREKNLHLYKITKIFKVKCNNISMISKTRM